MSAFSKLRGGLPKLFGGHPKEKENSSPPKTRAGTGDIKTHQASGSVMKSADVPPSAAPAPVAVRSVTTSATSEAVKTQQVSQSVVGKSTSHVHGIYDSSDAPGVHEKNLQTLERLVRKSIPAFEEFFGYKMSNDEFIFLGENNFRIFLEEDHYSAEFPYPVQEKAMNALITLLQNQPKISKLDFTVAKGHIRYVSLPILMGAVAAGKIPNVTELSFKGQQIAEFGERFFDVTKRFAGREKVKIQIDSGDGIKKDIREMTFSDL